MKNDCKDKTQYELSNRWRTIVFVILTGILMVSVPQYASCNDIWPPRGAWISSAYNKGGDEIRIAHLWVWDERIMLTEFRRDVSIGVTPAAWIREEHIEWGAGEYADYAFFHNADCDTLTLVRDRPVSQDLIHFHKYTDPMLVRGEEAVKWPPTALEASQMGRWVSGQGDAEDMAFMLWELVLLDSKDFELSLFLYDSKDLQRAWSLGFRFTGQINMKDGVLVAKKAYRVYNGTLQDVSNAETVQVAIRNDVVINYTEQCDRLTLLLPQEESAFMVLRFHSEQSRGTEKE